MLNEKLLAAQAQEVARRIGDYKAADFVAQRAGFLQAWREANPGP